MPMSSGRPRLAWLPGAAALLSLVACYGTLAVLAALGALGVAIALDEAVWAALILAFAALAVLGLALGLARHGRPWPLLVGLAGAAAIAYAFYVDYSRPAELAGFALLLAAAVWDRRLRRRPGAGT